MEKIKKVLDELVGVENFFGGNSGSLLYKFDGLELLIVNKMYQYGTYMVELTISGSNGDVGVHNHIELKGILPVAKEMIAENPLKVLKIRNAYIYHSGAYQAEQSRLTTIKNRKYASNELVKVKKELKDKFNIDADEQKVNQLNELSHLLGSLRALRSNYKDIQ